MADPKLGTAKRHFLNERIASLYSAAKSRKTLHEISLVGSMS
jgi:hypothetical protein